MLTKAINNGREHRRQFRGAKLYSLSCRNGGSCPWCSGNRQHGNQRRENAAAYIEEEARDEISDQINERDNRYILKV